MDAKADASGPAEGDDLPGRFTALTEALRTIECRHGGDDCDLDLAIETVNTVAEFINGDERALRDNIAGPLHRLQAALHDLRYGAKPEMFRVSGRGGGSNLLMIDGARGSLAGALECLIEAGMPAGEAADWLADKINRAGMSFPKIKDKLTGARLARWRHEVNASPSEVFNSNFRDFTAGVKAKAEKIGQPVTLDIAKLAAVSLIEALSRLGMTRRRFRNAPMP